MSDVVLRAGQDAPQAAPLSFVGAPARIDLLPDEVRREAGVRATRRLALLGIVGAVVIVAVAYVAVITVAGMAQARLDEAQAQTATLQLQQAKYQPVRELQRQVDAITSVGAVVTAGKLDWSTIDAHVRAGAPADAAFDSIAYSAQSPISAVPQLTGAFAEPLIGTVTVAMRSSDFNGLTSWLDVLNADPMFSGVSTNTVANETGWSTTVTIALSPELTPLPVTEDASGTGAPTPAPTPAGAAH